MCYCKRNTGGDEVNKLHEPYNKFKGAIRERGVTYEKIANLLNSTKSTICNKINGNSDFTISEVKTICTTYGIDRNIFLL